MTVARRTIRAWMMYDFANSAFAAIVQATVFPAFYANVVVGNADGRGDFWWGALVSVSMVLVALSSPLLGGIADHAGVRKPFFVALTALSVAATAALATLGPGMVREIATSAERTPMRRFLVAYLVYEDGVNTVISFSAVFAATTLGFSFPEIIALFMVVQVTALLGSAAWARATDERGPRIVVK